MRPSVRTILIVIAGAAAAFVLDMPAYRFVDSYIEGHEKDGIVGQIVFGFQDFAQTIPPLTVIALVWCLDRRHGREVVIRMFLAFVMAGAVSGIGKSLVGRYRPEPFRGETWRGTWIDVGPQHRSSKHQSFFSGHSTAAFTMATMLSACYPPVRPVVYTLATGCAVSRVVTENHWLSDVYIGSLAGMALGWVFLPARLRQGRRGGRLTQGSATGPLVGSSMN